MKKKMFNIKYIARVGITTKNLEEVYFVTLIIVFNRITDMIVPSKNNAVL